MSFGGSGGNNDDDKLGRVTDSFMKLLMEGHKSERKSRECTFEFMNATTSFFNGKPFKYES